MPKGCSRSREAGRCQNQNLRGVPKAEGLQDTGNRRSTELPTATALPNGRRWPSPAIAFSNSLSSWLSCTASSRDRRETTGIHRDSTGNGRFPPAVFGLEGFFSSSSGGRFLLATRSAHSSSETFFGGDHPSTSSGARTRCCRDRSYQVFRISAPWSPPINKDLQRKGALT